MSLLNKNDLKDLKKRLGPEAFAELKYRRTGRSTRIALATLLAALENPGQPQAVKDHFGTREADRLLLRTIAEMAERLGLNHLEFNRTNLTVTFTWENPFSKES